MTYDRVRARLAAGVVVLMLALAMWTVAPPPTIFTMLLAIGVSELSLPLLCTFAASCAHTRRLPPLRSAAVLTVESFATAICPEHRDRTSVVEPRFRCC